MIYWIGNSCILCLGRIIKINLTLRIHNDIFQQGITFDGMIYIRLTLLAQVNGFGVASSFKIENPIIVPPMFVITNKSTFRIR